MGIETANQANQANLHFAKISVILNQENVQQAKGSTYGVGPLSFMNQNPPRTHRVLARRHDEAIQTEVSYHFIPGLLRYARNDAKRKNGLLHYARNDAKRRAACRTTNLQQHGFSWLRSHARIASLRGGTTKQSSPLTHSTF